MLVFGPVPSRRLGRSLGINNIPPKSCSYSCVYCQVGQTGNTEIVPRMFFTPEQIYREMKDLADKLGVTVREQNFRASRVAVKSGSCLIKGKKHCIIDKNISLYKKTKVLAQSLSNLPHNNLYVLPAVRDIIDKYDRKNSGRRRTHQTDI